MVSEAQKKAVKKYQKKAYKTFLLNLHKKNDADIIDQLENVTSKNGFIKECIREKMQKK